MLGWKQPDLEIVVTINVATRSFKKLFVIEREDGKWLRVDAVWYAFLACYFLLYLIGCPLWHVATEPKDNCEPAATRCNKNIAEICGSDKRWDVNMDCSEITGPGDAAFVCCATTEGHTCLLSCENLEGAQ